MNDCKKAKSVLGATIRSVDETIRDCGGDVGGAWGCGASGGWFGVTIGLAPSARRATETRMLGHPPTMAARSILVRELGPIRQQ